MPLERGSLILVDYTARIKDTNDVFDTTREEEAKKTSLYDPTHKYEPRIVSIGESWVLKGLDEALSNANVGDKLNIEVPPEKGFGKRDDTKIRMIPQRKLGDKADEVGVGDEIENDIFKFVPPIKNIKFIETYPAPAEQKKDEEQQQQQPKVEATAEAKQ